MEVQKSGSEWVSSNVSIPFGLKYDLITDSLYPLPLSMGTASISWVCTGSSCDDSHLLANEEISFPDINFESGKIAVKTILKNIIFFYGET